MTFQWSTDDRYTRPRKYGFGIFRGRWWSRQIDEQLWWDRRCCWCKIINN